MAIPAFPIGRNCHVGSALINYGNHLPCIFKWADIQVTEVLAAIESDFASIRDDFEIYVRSPGALPSEGVTIPRKGAWAPMSEYAALPIPGGQKINCVVYLPSGSFIHGTQIDFSALRDVTAVVTENTAKLDRLIAVAREVLGREFLAIRFQETVSDMDRVLLPRLADALGRRLLLVTGQDAMAGMDCERSPSMPPWDNPLDLTGCRDWWLALLERREIEHGGTPKTEYAF